MKKFEERYFQSQNQTLDAELTMLGMESHWRGLIGDGTIDRFGKKKLMAVFSGGSCVLWRQLALSWSSAINFVGKWKP